MTKEDIKAPDGLTPESETEPTEPTENIEPAKYSEQTAHAESGETLEQGDSNANAQANDSDAPLELQGSWITDCADSEPWPREDTALDSERISSCLPEEASPEDGRDENTRSPKEAQKEEEEEEEEEETQVGASHLPPPPPPAVTPGAALDATPQGKPKTQPDEDEKKETDDETEDDEDAEEVRSMTLLDHLGELRVRLVRSLIAVGLGFLLCYGISDLLFQYLALPLVRVMPPDTKLIFTSIPEGFFVYLKVAFVAGIFLASPYIFYQVWSFIAPGLYDEEKKFAIPVGLCSAFFFLAGAAFCYFGVFPFAFTFFMSYSTDNIQAMPALDAYLGFSLKMLLAFGLIFEMPVFAFFLARMGIITSAWMRKVRKYAILAVFVVAAILTPPDVFSQLLMAVPMLILYEISIFVAAAVGRGKKSKKAKPAQGTPSPKAESA